MDSRPTKMTSTAYLPLFLQQKNLFPWWHYIDMTGVCSINPYNLEVLKERTCITCNI